MDPEAIVPGQQPIYLPPGYFPYGSDSPYEQIYMMDPQFAQEYYAVQEGDEYYNNMPPQMLVPYDYQDPYGMYYREEDFLYPIMEEDDELTQYRESSRENSIDIDQEAKEILKSKKGKFNSKKRILEARAYAKGKEHDRKRVGSAPSKYEGSSSQLVKNASIKQDKTQKKKTIEEMSLNINIPYQSNSAVSTDILRKSMGAIEKREDLLQYRETLKKEKNYLENRIKFWKVEMNKLMKMKQKIKTSLISKKSGSAKELDTLLVDLAVDLPSISDRTDFKKQIPVQIQNYDSDEMETELKEVKIMRAEIESSKRRNSARPSREVSKLLKESSSVDSPKMCLPCQSLIQNQKLLKTEISPTSKSGIRIQVAAMKEKLKKLIENTDKVKEESRLINEKASQEEEERLKEEIKKTDRIINSLKDKLDITSWKELENKFAGNISEASSN